MRNVNSCPTFRVSGKNIPKSDLLTPRIADDSIGKTITLPLFKMPEQGKIRNGRLYGMTLRKRIFLYLVLVSVIPITLVGIVSYTLSFRNISSNAVNSNISISDRMASEVRKLL